MKTIVIVMFGLLIMALAFRVLFADVPSTGPASAPSPTTAPSSGDAGTDLVVGFYKALLQETPPTLEQEKSLFNPLPGIRARLVAGGQGKDKDPLILEFFRKNKAIFFPKKLRSVDSVDDVAVSSTFYWVQNLKRKMETPKKGNGYVLAMFFEDPTADQGQIKRRTIVFPIEDGKIEAGGIWLDGFGNKLSLEEFLKVEVQEPPDR